MTFEQHAENIRRLAMTYLRVDGAEFLRRVDAELRAAVEEALEKMAWGKLQSEAKAAAGGTVFAIAFGHWLRDNDHE